MAEKGGNLALRIRIRRTIGGQEWEWSLEPCGPEARVIDTVLVVADSASAGQLEGLVVDWVQTPQGAGFGVYDRNLRNVP